MTEEQLLYSRQQAPPKTVTSTAPKQLSKPARTGYEKYQNFEHVSDLQVDQTLWGPATQAPQAKTTQPSLAAQRKMMSLEEVEAQMQAQKKAPSVQPQQPQQQGGIQIAQRNEGLTKGRSPPLPAPAGSIHPSHYQGQHVQQPQVELPANVPRFPQVLQRPPQQPIPLPSAPGQPPQPGAIQGRVPPPMPHHGHGLSQPGIPGFAPQQIITHPTQMSQLSDADRAVYLREEAKRAKRNHKIFLLSKDNGLMTPQDKNFITRIQLQQLMAAAGSTNETDPDAVLSEDFYYQVHRQIRGGPRANPQQPLSHFAQTYLFQTGGRHSGLNRRHHRGGDNHMQRMEQQVQRAVEAAKQKPKNKQLVIEGSLGKISFSNAKTPKPLLNIKRPEGGDASGKTARTAGKRDATLTINNKRSALKDIEGIYTVLMKLEDEARKEPPPPSQESNSEDIQRHMEWRHGMQELNAELWNSMKVLEPIDSDSQALHPFISILSYPKGKKAIPRVFRHLSSEQRVTMLTMIVIHLDVLDVVRYGQLQPGETQLPAAAREAIELFSAVVTPSLFMYVSEAPLFNVIGLLGLILDRVNIHAVARTRVGLSILTMLTSRATLVREAGATEEGEWQQWTQLYNRLFDTLEPVMSQIFPGSVNTGEDMHVWQFLAAIGSGASPEQQQRLVIAVK